MITVNEDPVEHTDGMTVRDVLRACRFLFPLVIVRVDGELVPRDCYDTTPVPDKAIVQVIHMMSGG